MANFQKIFVTGADGLLGGNLVRELLNQGYFVRAFVQRTSAAATLDGLPVDIVKGDLLDANLNTLDRAMEGCDAVFHCAAITDMRAPDAVVWRVNHGGTRNIVEAALRAGIKRFVHTASASSYQAGTKANPGDESGAFPAEYRKLAYMESKAAATAYVRQRIEDEGLDAVFVAPTFMIGPHDTRPSSGELIRQFIRRRMRVVSPGGRNFAYVGDVAKGMVAALEKGVTGECYLLGGENLTYMEFFSKVADTVKMDRPKWTLPQAAVSGAGSLGSAWERVTGKPVALNHTLAKLACMHTFYSSKKAVEKLGLPQTSMDLAVREAVEGLKQYGHL